jgi:hypothetical protein
MSTTKSMTVIYKGFGPPVTRVFVCWLGIPLQHACFDSEDEAIAYIDDVVQKTKGVYKKTEYSLRIESVDR